MCTLHMHTNTEYCVTKVTPDMFYCTKPYYVHSMKFTIESMHTCRVCTHSLTKYNIQSLLQFKQSHYARVKLSGEKNNNWTNVTTASWKPALYHKIISTFNDYFSHLFLSQNTIKSLMNKIFAHLIIFLQINFMELHVSFQITQKQVFKHDIYYVL